jgi:LmbE family N-acetylglucosaminyl deacetylase
VLSILEKFCLGKAPSIALVAAHPDDEVIGAGAQLCYWKNLSLIHVTDGAPRNLGDAHAAGFLTRSDYARARRRELESALKLALAPARFGVRPLRCSERISMRPEGLRPNRSRIHLFPLDFPDQEASFHLVEVSLILAQYFRCLSPEFVLTHPYEGGHPDHDSTAFAVQSACALLRLKGQRAPRIVEMTSYHNRAGMMMTGQFLPNSQNAVLTCELTPAERHLKQSLFACFKTQANVLHAFQADHESFRLAPTYDFTKPPHCGRLYYENFNWGMTGPRWRHLAQIATAHLLPRTPLYEPGQRDPLMRRFGEPRSASTRDSYHALV